jgi:hypothetical protein
MIPDRWFGVTCWLLAVFVAIIAAASSASATGKEKVLYSLQGGSNGSTPAGGVVFDKAGNLYGVNSWGGSGCPSPGCGTVYQLSPPVQKGGAWTETIIHAFQGLPNDGYTPEGGLIIDSLGNLYGTTSLGGSGPCILLGSNGWRSSKGGQPPIRHLVRRSDRWRWCGLRLDCTDGRRCALEGGHTLPIQQPRRRNKSTERSYYRFDG